MALYLYKCNSCEEIIEIEHKMSESIKDCPLCKNEGVLQRYFTASSIPLTKFIGEWAGESIKRNKGEQ